MKALIVIDCQNDFSELGAIKIYGALNLAKNIKDYIEIIKQKEPIKIIATKDWHPKHHCSFNIWPPHCIKHSKGSKLIEPLHKNMFDKIIYKAKHRSYDELSGFYHQKKSKLYKYLVKHKISEIMVCGLIKEYCVQATVLDAKKLGFKVSIIDELVLGKINMSRELN